MFPFLIGRIRTIDDGTNFDLDIRFPFLIGRIRTKNADALIISACMVSIPHR